MWYHPKYYKNLRKLARLRNRVGSIDGAMLPDSQSDQAISLTLADGCNGSVRPGPGQQPQASSNKLQATSSERFKLQAASIKPQAQRLKLKAASNKLPDPGSLKKFQAPLIKGLYQDK